MEVLEKVANNLFNYLIEIYDNRIMGYVFTPSYEYKGYIDGVYIEGRIDKKKFNIFISNQDSIYITVELGYQDGKILEELTNTVNDYFKPNIDCISTGISIEEDKGQGYISLNDDIVNIYGGKTLIKE